MLIYICCGISLVFIPRDFSLWESLILSVAYALIVFFIFLLSYSLNLIVDNTFEISSSGSSDNIEPIDDIPEGISKNLWNIRNQYLFDQNHASDTAIELIQIGYKAEEVFQLVNYMSNQQQNPGHRSSSVQHTYLMGSDTKARKSNKEPTYGYLKCCSKVHRFPFTRRQINDAFSHEQSILYIIISTVLTFLMVLAFCQSTNQYPNTLERVYAALIAGLCLFSLFKTPESDPYTLVRSDRQNSFTRPFYIAVLSAILVLCGKLKEWCGETIEIPELGLTIVLDKVLPHINECCRYLIFLYPIIIFFIIPPMNALITWFFEFVSRYLFGLSGATGLINSIFQFVRSFCVCALLYCAQRYIHFKMSDALFIAIASVLLFIPITRIEKFPLFHLFYSLYTAVILFVVLAFIDGVSNYKAMIYPFIAVYFLVYLIVPLLFSNTVYFFLSFGFTKVRPKFFLYVQYIVQPIIISVILGVIRTHDSKNGLFSSLLCVFVINRTFSNPSNFAIGLFFFIHFIEERLWSSWGGALFLGCAFARKSCFLFDIVKSFMTAQVQLLDLFLYDEEELLYIAMIIPNFERFCNGACLFWRAVTGAPALFPAGLNCFQFLLCPRPNNMFESVKTSQLDVNETIHAHVIDHPMEAPIYLSAAQGLRNSIMDLAAECYFGVYDENDYFILKSDTMSMFLQIVALSPHCIHFQIRGLEYTEETSCHQAELESLANISHLNEAPDYVNSSLFYTFGVAKLVTKNMSFKMYNISHTPLRTLLSSLSRDQIVKFICYSAAHYIAKNVDLVVSLPMENVNQMLSDNQEQEVDFQAAINFFVGEDVDEQVKMHCVAALKAITRGFLVDPDKIWVQIYSQFHEKCTFPDPFAFVENDDTIMLNIIAPAARLAILSLYLLSASLVEDPELDENLKDHFEHVFDDFVVCCANSDEFATNFELGQRGLVTLECTKAGTMTIMYFTTNSPNWHVFKMSRENVRGLWASQINEQIFWKQDDSERFSIQYEIRFFHNLVNQSCDMPCGYPAYVSPVLSAQAINMFKIKC